MNDLVTTNEGFLPVSEKTVKQFLFSSDTKLTEQQQIMFMNMAIKNNLDPFKREIYVVAYGSNFNIITGYQVYIQRAERSGKLNGWGVEISKNNEEATITILRKDWNSPFKWTVYREEHDTGKATWKSMPKFMLRKVAIAQGFRMCFPEELGGMPYAEDEIQGEPIKANYKVNYIPSDYEIEEFTKLANYCCNEKAILWLNEKLKENDIDKIAFEGAFAKLRKYETEKKELIKSIQILRKENNFDDDEFKLLKKEMFKVDSLKELTIDQLKNFKAYIQQ